MSNFPEGDLDSNPFAAAFKQAGGENLLRQVVEANFRTLQISATKLGRQYNSWVRAIKKIDQDFELLKEQMKSLLADLAFYTHAERVQVFQRIEDGMEFNRRDGELDNRQLAFMEAQAYQGDTHIGYLWNTAGLSRRLPTTYFIYATFLLTEQSSEDTEIFCLNVKKFKEEPKTEGHIILTPELLASWFFRNEQKNHTGIT